MKAAACSRVERLETALAVLGETVSTETRGLQAALKEARRAAQERPIAAEAEECQAFIKRSENRLVRLEEERVKERKEFDAAWLKWPGSAKRWPGKFRSPLPLTEPDVTQPGKVPDLVAELEPLRSRVAEMEIERPGNGPGLCQFLHQIWLAGQMSLCKSGGTLHDQRVGQHRGAIMETLISRGNSMAQNSNRFSPLA